MSDISVYQLNSKVAVLRKVNGVNDLFPSLYEPSEINLKRVNDTDFRLEIKGSSIHVGDYASFGSNKSGKDTLSEEDLIRRFSTFGINDESPNFYKFFNELDETGNETGNVDATGNYLTDTFFAIKHIEGDNPIFVNRIITTIQDSGSVDAASYGNGIALTNGILLQKIDKNNNIIIDFTAGQSILTNTDWGTNCFDVKPSEFGGGNNYVLAKWTLTKDSNGKGLRLEDGERLVMRLKDDFTGLVGHKFKGVGYVDA